MSTGGERWSGLRDREAIGEPLSAQEVDELSRLEATDPDARALAAQIHDLETYLDAGRDQRSTAADRDVVDRALAAVQVTTGSGRLRTVDSDAELARVVDPDGPGWIRTLAIGSSIAMAAAAAWALIMFEPQSVRRATHDARDVTAPVIAPTVEALASAHTAKRGAKLRRQGSLLAEGAVLSQGDELSAGEKPGCFVIEPQTDVCLAAGSTARIASLSLAVRSVEVVRGRAVANLDAPQPVGKFELVAGEVHAVAAGTVFGLERNEDASFVRVRVLKGRVMVLAAERASEVSDAHVAVYRGQERTLEQVDLATGQAQREWELVATGMPWSGAAAPVHAPDASAREPSVADAERTAQSKVLTPALLPPEPAENASTEKPTDKTDGPKTARDLLKDAWELLKEKRWAEAARVYQTIQRDFPKSDEAHVVLVRLGDLELEHLAEPAQALAAFERYLRQGGGPLEAEARFGRIEALAKLGRKTDERRAIDEFLRMHATSLKVPALKERLRALGAN